MRFSENRYYFQLLLDKIKHFFFHNNHECSITIPTHKRAIKRAWNSTFNKTDYSLRFRAINYFLLHHTISDITELCEIQNIEEDYCGDETNREYILIPNNRGKVKISENPDIFFENIVFFQEESSESGENSTENKSNTQKISKSKNYNYRISTPGIQSIHILQDFIESCELEYNQSKETDQQMIFEYIETVQSCDEDSYYKQPTLIFHNYPFHSNKFLDKNVFFENRQEILDKIRKFPKRLHHISDTNKYKNDSKNNSTNKQKTSHIKTAAELEYDYKGIPYKYALLLHGEPGCGKTSVIKGILNETKRHGVIVQWSRLKTCRDFSALFRQLKINNQTYGLDEICYIFEDFDANRVDVFKQRTSQENQTNNAQTSTVGKHDYVNIMTSSITSESDKKMISSIIKQDDELTLDYILNLFDGVIELYNAMIIFTTNMPLNTFDSALIRPGRIDAMIEMKKCTVNIIREMFIYNFEVAIENMDKYEPFFNKMTDYAISPSAVQMLMLSFSHDSETCLQQIVDACNRTPSSSPIQQGL